MADSMPPAVALIWADFHFMSGGANRTLQAVVGADPDGAVGPKTIAAIGAACGDTERTGALLLRLNAARVAYDRSLEDSDRQARVGTARE